MHIPNCLFYYYRDFCCALFFTSPHIHSLKKTECPFWSKAEELVITRELQQ